MVNTAGWRALAAAATFVVFAAPALAADPLAIHVLYVEQKIARPPTLSNLDPPPPDLGLQGARLGIIDNNTTGKFLKQSFDLVEVVAEPGADLIAAARPKLAQFDLIVVNAPAPVLLALADLPETKGRLLFDIGAYDERLREEDCRANVLHTLPSRAMLTDALVQFLVKKKWPQILLIAGTTTADKAYAAALEASAAKFGAKIVERKDWTANADLRDTAAEEVPLMTQGAAYDVVAVADEGHDFGATIAYNSWDARPVVGTHGLVPAGWSAVIEPWGAVQLQNRFKTLAKRGMQPVDFAAWAALRLIGEAANRTGVIDAASVRAYALSDKLQLSAFKGRGLSFRVWNGQLRQPIHLVTSDNQVAVAPIGGFLHQRTDLDTLGLDEPESKCKAFKP